jgi:hypothetical protein
VKVKSKKNLVIIGIISLLYFLYRVANSLIVDSLFDDYDSPNYFKLSFFPSIRTHGITLFFSLIKNESLISVFQAAVGALVWIYLWLSILFKIRNMILKVLFSILFFILASSSVVVEHDSAMMSESLSISSTIFLFSSAINLKKESVKNSSVEVYIFAFAIIWFMSTKATNSLIFIPLATIMIFISYRKLSTLRFFQLFCSFSVLATFLFLSVLASDATQSLTTSGTINNRLIFVPEWKEQLMKTGYPESAFITWERFSQENLGLPPDQAVVSLPEFEKWWEQGGDSYLLNFTLRNPNYALIAPVALPLFSENFNYKKTLLSGWSQGTDLTFDYAQFNNSLLMRTFLWPDEPEKAYLLLSVTFLTIGLSLAFLNKFNFTNEFSIIIFSIILTVFWSYLNWWFGSKPADMARHNLSAAILFKIIAIYAITVSIDKILAIRKIDVVKLHQHTGVRT